MSFLSLINFLLSYLSYLNSKNLQIIRNIHNIYHQYLDYLLDYQYHFLCIKEFRINLINFLDFLQALIDNLLDQMGHFINLRFYKAESQLLMNYSLSCYHGFEFHLD